MPATHGPAPGPDPEPPSAVLLLGPTASGKSALAMALAREVPLEIVSLDSAQVYRGLDVGAAKPGAGERALVPHHLLDLRDPSEPYSAAQWRGDALRAIRETCARGRLALVTGGTMMYARVLRQGIAELPPASPEVRERIERQAAELGWPALHARLAEVDPVTAARLAPRDRQRIGRALEVHAVTGKPLSELLRGPGAAGDGSGGSSHPPDLRLRTIALVPEDRARLHRQIAQRFDAMLEAGFLDEVRALRARPDLHAGLPALRAVGYRQAWEHLEQGTPFARFREAAIAATRQLARRQLTWLRSMEDAINIDPFEDGALERLREAVGRP
jgi:tRNA dimethylallyltransferase